MKRANKKSLITQYINGNPEATVADIAKKFKTGRAYIYQVKSAMKKKIIVNQGQWEAVKKLAAQEFTKEYEKLQDDNVNHPAHYKTGGIETIDFIEAKELDYHLGNVIKYITRAKHKGDELENLKKAQWYLNRKISNLTGDQA